MATTDSIISSKVCTMCKRELPLTPEYWSPAKLGKYGFNSRCKSCLAKVAREERASKGAVTRPNRKRDGQKQCSKCDVWYPATSEFFGVCSHHVDGLRSWCRSCLRQENKSYMQDRRLNPDVILREYEYDKRYRSNPVIKERKRLYRIEHTKDPIVKAARKQYTHEYERRPERRLKRRVRSSATRLRRKAVPGSYTAEDVQLLLRTQKRKCWWCGKKLTGKYEVDHRIPIARGGTNWPNNLCIACFECNRTKHTKLPHEFNGRLL